MSRIILNTKIWLFVLLFGMSFPAWAQSDDFNTWTKFKVNYKIDSRFSVSGDLELRMKDDVSRLDRWGLTVGGSYRPCSFLNLGVGYETHLRNLGDSDWKLRHRYHISATANFRYPMLLQKESFLLIFLLKFIKVWMIPLFGEQTVCAIVPEWRLL